MCVYVCIFFFNVASSGLAFQNDTDFLRLSQPTGIPPFQTFYPTLETTSTYNIAKQLYSNKHENPKAYFHLGPRL